MAGTWVAERPSAGRPAARRSGVALLPALCAVAGAGLVAWWVVGPMDTGDDHVFGPFDLPAWAGPTTAALGLCLLVSAAAAAVAPALRRGPKLAVTTVALLTLAAVLAGVSWRVLTAGAVGANIGGGVLLLFGPFLLSSLLMPVVAVETHRRSAPRWMLASLLTLAALPGVLSLAQLLAG